MKWLVIIACVLLAFLAWGIAAFVSIEKHVDQVMPGESPYVNIQDTPTDLNTEQLGEKYPRLMINGVRLRYDPDQKWYVATCNPLGLKPKENRVMWMGGSGVHVELLDKMNQGPVNYKLTPDGYVLDPDEKRDFSLPTEKQIHELGDTIDKGKPLPPGWKTLTPEEAKDLPPLPQLTGGKK